MAETQVVRDQIYGAVRQKPKGSLDGLLEAGFGRLFMGLVYPQIWEDPVVDMAALDLGPSDHIVCIASGGCNMMSYLTARPASILAVDLSPAHVALGRLKLAAASRLDQPAFRRFFADADTPENVRAYDRLVAPALDARSRAYWEARPLGRRRISQFARGFYRFGVLGRFIGTLAIVARLGGVDLREMAKAPDLAAQQHFFDTRLVPLLESRVVRALARRRASLFGLGIPPAQYDKLAADGGGDVLPVLRERIRKLLCDFPLRDSYFARQALTRRYAPGPDAAVPPYLQAAHFDAVRDGAPRVRIENRLLTEALREEPAGSRTAFVLLDAQDWMTDAQLADLWTAIDRTAHPRARVIFRTGGTADILPGRLPAALLDRWQRDASASAAGHAADRSAIYGGFHLYRRAA